MTLVIESTHALARSKLWVDQQLWLYGKRRCIRYDIRVGTILLLCCFTVFLLLLLLSGGGDDGATLPSKDELLAQVGRKDRYKKVIGVARATKQFQRERVTISTQASFEYLHHLIDLVERWDGPIAAAVYTPGDTYTLAVKTVDLLRKCYPKVKSHVTFSFFYPSYLSPNHVDKAQLFGNRLDNVPCGSVIFPIAPNRVTAKYGLYPVNAGRNTARETVATEHVLVMDIELKPSKGLEQAFLSMLVRHDKYPDLRWQNKNVVYVLPVFEVQDGEKIPEDKSELVKLINDEKSVYFHKVNVAPRLKYETTTENPLTKFLTDLKFIFAICLCRIVVAFVTKSLTTTFG